MQCGRYPARAAQAGIRLPPTLEADKPDLDSISTRCYRMNITLWNETLYRYVTTYLLVMPMGMTFVQIYYIQVGQMPGHFGICGPVGITNTSPNVVTMPAVSIKHTQLYYIS